MNNKIGMMYSFWAKEWEDDIRPFIVKASKLGFDILEFNANSIISMSAEKLNEVRKIAQDCNITLTACFGLGPYTDISSEDAEVRKAGAGYVWNCLKALNALGIKIVAGVNYGAWQRYDKVIDDKRLIFERSAKSLKEFMGFCEDNGILYCMEIVNRFENVLLNTAAEGTEMCKAVGSPNIKLHLDTYHMNIEEDFIPKTILESDSYIGHFHVGEGNRKLPGMGKQPWDEIFSALSRVGYKGAIVMEPFMKMGGQIGHDVALWRDLSNNAEEKDMDKMAYDALMFVKGKLAKC